MNFKNLIAGLIYLFFLNSCTGFKPIYKTNLKQIYILKDFVIVTDQAPVSKKIKRELITLLPKNKKQLIYFKN